MKLAHYLKIPLRTLFFAQGIATILGALTQVGVTLWMLGNVEGICTSDQPNGFTCPNGLTVYSSSIIWGLIGPGRLYSAGKIYSGLLHFFWIGLILPPITYYVFKRTRSEFVRKINWPLIFVGTYNVPPATGVNFSSWYLVNLIFNKIIYSRFRAWWTKVSRIYLLSKGKFWPFHDGFILIASFFGSIIMFLQPPWTQDSPSRASSYSLPVSPCFKSTASSSQFKAGFLL